MERRLIINPKTQRLIGLGSKSYWKLRKDPKYRTKILKEPLLLINDKQNWDKFKPKTKKEREELLNKCGPNSFLEPSTLKYPIAYPSCKQSCQSCKKFCLFCD